MYNIRFTNIKGQKRWLYTKGVYLAQAELDYKAYKQVYVDVELVKVSDGD
jgi:hypothetical protein